MFSLRGGWGGQCGLVGGAARSEVNADSIFVRYSMSATGPSFHLISLSSQSSSSSSLVATSACVHSTDMTMATRVTRLVCVRARSGLLWWLVVCVRACRACVVLLVGTYVDSDVVLRGAECRAVALRRGLD